MERTQFVVFCDKASRELSLSETPEATLCINTTSDTDYASIRNWWVSIPVLVATFWQFLFATKMHQETRNSFRDQEQRAICKLAHLQCRNASGNHRRLAKILGRQALPARTVSVWCARFIFRIFTLRGEEVGRFFFL